MICASTKLAFELLVLTAAPSNEVRLATWREIDRPAAVWTIPAARVKARRKHRVPLFRRAIEILDEATTLGSGPGTAGGSGLVFPSVRGRALSDNTLSKLVREHRLACVPHGFRSSFRDWASEQTSYRREVVEAALAHVVGNQTEGRLRAFGPARSASKTGGRLGGVSRPPTRHGHSAAAVRLPPGG